MRAMDMRLLLAALLLAAAPPAHAQQDDQAICEGWAAEQAMPLLQQSLAITPSGAPPYGPAGWSVFVGPFGAGPWGVAALGGPPGLVAASGPLGPGPTAFSLAPTVLAPSPAGTGGPNPAALATSPQMALPSVVVPKNTVIYTASPRPRTHSGNAN